MMKNLIFGFVLFGLNIYSQAPQKINYQGILRDASGVPVSTITSINVAFIITDNTSSIVHNETVTAVPVNSLGLFNTQIGKLSAISNTVTWANGPYNLAVSVNMGSGFNLLGTQELVSVPYALYAKSAGNGSIPPGTKAGQTLRWDGLVWRIDSNLTNDGAHIGVGLYPAGLQSRLHVTTNTPSDTNVILAYHSNINSKGAGLRSVVLGNTSYNTDPFQTAIYGNNSAAFNSGNGAAIGNFGFGRSNGLGVGVFGVGYGASATSTAAGIYATAIGHPNANKIAGVFDKGKVLFNDSLFIIGTNTVGANIGDVLTYMPNGQAKWQPAGAGSSPWSQGSGFIYHPTMSDRVTIGSGSVMPMGKLEVFNNSGNSIDGMRLTDNGTADGLHVFKMSTTGQGINLYMGNTSSGTAFNISHLGTGPGITASTGTNVAVQANSSGTIPTISGSNSGSGAGVRGNSTGGFGVLGTVQSPTAAVGGINQYTLVNSQNAHGIYGVTFNPDLLASGVFGESKGAGYGVYGINTNSTSVTSGVYGTVNNAGNILSSGVKGEVNGNGSGVHGFNTGVGPGVKASAGSATASALSLLLDNGHIRSVQPNPPTFTTSIGVGGFATPTGTVFSAGSTDVKGNISFSTSVTGFLPTNYCDIQVKFAKPYNTIPIVIVTPTTDILSMSYGISAVSTTAFTLRLYKTNGAGFPISFALTGFSFNYIVIE